MYDTLLELYEGQKRGTRYNICCIYHKEKTPSLSVRLDTGLWKCFGCGRAGGILQLVTDLEDGDVHKARRLIAQHRRGTGLMGEMGASPIQKVKESTKVQYMDAGRLNNFVPVSTARYTEYLKARGIDLDLALQHELKQGSIMDSKWNYRILYPIRTLEGEVASIEGRGIYDHIEPRYHKEKGSRAGLGAFGIDKLARHTAQKLTYLFIVEGTFDTLSCWQVGERAVGIGSSSLSETQIMQIKRIARIPIVVFDGTKDTAESRKGRAQALQTNRRLLAQHFTRFGIEEIPETDQDPNDLLRAGTLKQYLEGVKHGL